MKKIKITCLLVVCCLMLALVACGNTDVPLIEMEKGENVETRLASYEYDDYVNLAKSVYQTAGNYDMTGPLKPVKEEELIERDVEDTLTPDIIIALALSQLENQYNVIINQVGDETNRKIVYLAYKALSYEINNCSGSNDEVITQIDNLINKFNNVITLINEDIITFEQLIENFINKLEVAHDSVKVLISDDDMDEILPMYLYAKDIFENTIPEGLYKEPMYKALEEFVSAAYGKVVVDIPSTPVEPYSIEMYVIFKYEMMNYVDSFLCGYEDKEGYVEVLAYCECQIATVSDASTMEEFDELAALAKANIYLALVSFVDETPEPIIPEVPVTPVVTELEALKSEAIEKIKLMIEEVVETLTDEDLIAKLNNLCEFEVGEIMAVDSVENFNTLTNSIFENVEYVISQVKSEALNR